jgi:hypothetical protein
VRRRALAAIALLLAAAAAGCTSPEATRMRAGGGGADVGNHGEVQLHAGSDPYYRTPTRGAGLGPPPGGKEVAASTKPR